MPHCEIHTFDQVTFGNGTIPQNSKSWPMIVEELNHTNHSIDIFKIDIDGDEYQFFLSLFESSKNYFPRQILVEIHPKAQNTMHGFFELLCANNYVIFNKEPNHLASTYFFEYTFLKLNSCFFR
jgi:hypothetical protein